MKLNQKGVGAIGILLLIVIVGIIGGTGYYVYNAQKKTNQNLDNASASLDSASESNKQVQQAEKDEFADWKTISTEDKKITVKYPADLAAKECTRLDGVKFISLSPYADKGLCGNYEMPGYINISYQPVYDGLDRDCKTEISEEGVTATAGQQQVSGRTVCVETVAISEGSSAESIGVLYEYVKSKEYRYVDGGVVYYSYYTQFPGYPDRQSDFDKIVRQVKYN